MTTRCVLCERLVWDSVIAAHFSRCFDEHSPVDVASRPPQQRREQLRSAGQDIHAELEMVSAGLLGGELAHRMPATAILIIINCLDMVSLGRLAMVSRGWFTTSSAIWPQRRAALEARHLSFQPLRVRCSEAVDVEPVGTTMRARARDGQRAACLERLFLSRRCCVHIRGLTGKQISFQVDSLEGTARSWSRQDIDKALWLTDYDADDTDVSLCLFTELRRNASLPRKKTTAMRLLDDVGSSAGLQKAVDSLGPLMAEGWRLHWADTNQFAEMTGTPASASFGAFYYSRSTGMLGDEVCWKLNGCPFGWAFCPETDTSTGTKNWGRGVYHHVCAPGETHATPPAASNLASPEATPPSLTHHQFSGVLTQLLVGDINNMLCDLEGTPPEQQMLIDVESSRKLLHHDAPLISVISPNKTGNEDLVVRLDLALSGRGDQRSAQAAWRAYRAIRAIHPLTVRERTDSTRPLNSPWRTFADGPGTGWWCTSRYTMTPLAAARCLHTAPEERLRIAECRRRVAVACRELEVAERELVLTEGGAHPDVHE